MDPELRDLLRGLSSNSHEKQPTHVSFYGPEAEWTVLDDDQQTFWDGYCNIVNRPSHQTTNTVCLGEKPQSVMPVIADFTFRFEIDDSDDGNWEPYQEDLLQCICCAYQTVIQEFFQINTETYMELAAVIMESENHWYEEDESKHQRFMVMSLRIQFPYCKVSVDLQKKIIRPHVIKYLRNKNVMSRFQRQPTGDWDTIISNSALTSPVTMYGSNSIPGQPKLKICHIWQYIPEDELDLSNERDEISLEDAFIPSMHDAVLKGTINRIIFDSASLSHWTPLFLSINYWHSVVLLNTKDNIPSSSTPQSTVFGVGKRQRVVEMSDIQLAETMLTMIDSSRFFQEAYFLDIGRALYSADNGGDVGLNSWIYYTTKALTECPAFIDKTIGIEGTCRDLYHTFSTSCITVKTLAWYAHLDAPDRYEAWHKEWCTPSMEQALSGLDTDIAEALYRVYWLRFIYCPVGPKGKWFQFRNHRWSQAYQGIGLLRLISSDFMKKFEYARMMLSRQIHESTDEGFKSAAETTIKKITSLIAKLKTGGVKHAIIREAQENFENVKYYDLIDSNVAILGLTNGVLEMSDVVTFRAAKPEDYVSMCTNIAFPVNFHMKHPLVQECMKWFYQVFGSDELVHHFLKFSASCLKGLNSDKIFPIFTGEGDNSKSMIVKLYENALGMYCIKFDVSNFTARNNNPSGPTPQTARARGTRIAFIDEAPDDVPLHKDTLKRWIGGDSFYTRTLQAEGGEVKITFKLVMTSNKVPVFVNADQAMENRVRLIPFGAKWVADAPESEEEQIRLRRFKRNPFFEKRIPILAQSFLWLMTQYYPYYIAEGLVSPAIVVETTRAYWQDNDIYAQFAADNIQEVYDDLGAKDTMVKTSLTQIYTAFKIWYKDSFPNGKVPERNVVKTELGIRWGRIQNNCWYGIRLVENNPGGDMAASLGGRPMTQPTVSPVTKEEVKASTTVKTPVKQKNAEKPPSVFNISKPGPRVPLDGVTI